MWQLGKGYTRNLTVNDAMGGTFTVYPTTVDGQPWMVLTGLLVPEIKSNRLFQ